MDMVTTADAAPSSAGFDYTQLDDAAAGEARAVVERYRERQKAYLIDTGRDLLAVKAWLEHGMFLEWVQSEMQMTPRTAQRAMGVFEALGDKSDTVSYLPPSVLYALSAPSLPAPVRQDIVGRIEAGEDLSPRKVEGILHEARITARQEKAEAKQTPEERKRRAKSKREAEARHRRDVEKWRAERAEEEAKRKADADELAGILAPLLDPDAYSRVYNLVHFIYTTDMREALSAAWSRTEVGRAYLAQERAAFDRLPSV